MTRYFMRDTPLYQMEQMMMTPPTALLTLISGESHFKGTATVHRSLKDKGERR